MTIFLKYLFRILLLTTFAYSLAFANNKEIVTNEVIIHNPPKWLKATRVEKITNRIQHKLEWSTRKIHIYWYDTLNEFTKTHSFGQLALAVTQHPRGQSIIQMSPKIDSDAFDTIFAHELVHVIVFQKYKEAIPKWLEEGLANHLSNHDKINYKWLASQPFPKDVKDLAHPFASGGASSTLYRYKASQAFAEMLNKKCDLDNLIRLSVERKMENYMRSYCGIDNLNTAFKDWVTKNAK
ncbi:MAG: hypothetical protein KDD38_02510 [Bdellovibrionales bacterium]|nr:hypothetical protein [Bdellovibrionales bacterium]